MENTVIVSEQNYNVAVDEQNNITVEVAYPSVGQAGPRGYTGSAGQMGYTGSAAPAGRHVLTVTANEQIQPGQLVASLGNQGDGVTWVAPFYAPIHHPRQLIGIATTSIAAFDSADITTYGPITGLDLTGLGEGELVASLTVPGGLVAYQGATINAHPLIFVGWVLDAVSGAMFVKLDATRALEELDQTAIANPSAGQVLGYNGTSWTNVTNPGYTGSVGPQGTTGYTGSLGYTGSKGADGVIGYNGSIGYTGSQGIQGFTGSIGFTGSQGVSGYTGSAGAMGYTGSIGYTGSMPAIVDQITFDTGTGFVGSQAGQLWWDGEATLNLQMLNGVTQQIGQESYFYGKASGTINNGSIVMFGGAEGDHVLLAPVNVNTPGFHPRYVIGVATQTINNGEFGYVTCFGKVHQVNTSAYAAGALLYLDPATGGFTDVEPSSLKIVIAAVIRQHATEGSLMVRPDFSYYLHDLHDVELSVRTAGQILGYNGSQWYNRNQISSILELGITDGTANQVLKTDGAGTQLFDSLKTINGNSLLGAGNLVISGGDSGGLGSLVAYNADGSQDDIQLNAYTSLSQITIQDELVLANDSVVSMGTTAVYGWRDLFAPIDPRGGASAPAWTLFRNGIYLYAFPGNQSREVFATFHIDHDYALGTKLYPHVHYTVNTTSTGVVRWGFEYTVAKGHQQATGSTYGPTTTVYVEQTINGAADQYKHFVAEVSEVDAISGLNVEPDTIILVRIFRDAGNVNDTYPDNVYGIQADMHYQANTWATKNKAPNFYN